MPPEPMTKVAAIASTPIVEVASRMFNKLLSDRKNGDSTAMTALSTISTTKRFQPDMQALDGAALGTRPKRRARAGCTSSASVLAESRPAARRRAGRLGS